jgi:hypothetical protein
LITWDRSQWIRASPKSALGEGHAQRGIVDYFVGGRLSATWVDHIASYPKKVATDAAFSNYLKSLARSDFHKEIEGNLVPIKVIIGQHDPALTEELMRSTYLRWHPNAELEIMANSGHYPMNETPVALAAANAGNRQIRLKVLC